MPDTNPISQVYAGIWTMLEANSDFTSLVRAGNRIKYVDGNMAATKQTLSDNDTPQVAVMPLGLSPHLDKSSSTSYLGTLWSIELVSGTVKTETLSQLDWAIYRAMADWRTHLSALTWNSRTFVSLFRPMKVDNDFELRRKLRVPEGWNALWTGECQMWFQSTEVKPTTTTTTTTTAAP
jgi:hypothetical protein